MFGPLRNEVDDSARALAYTMFKYAALLSNVKPKVAIQTLLKAFRLVPTKKRADFDFLYDCLLLLESIYLTLDVSTVNLQQYSHLKREILDILTNFNANFSKIK